MASSSVSILEDEEAAEELVECTELSVEERSESRESRIVAERKNIISEAFEELQLAVFVDFKPLKTELLLLLLCTLSKVEL